MAKYLHYFGCRFRFLYTAVSTYHHLILLFVCRLLQKNTYLLYFNLLLRTALHFTVKFGIITG